MGHHGLSKYVWTNPGILAKESDMRQEKSTNPS